MSCCGQSRRRIDGTRAEAWSGKALRLRYLGGRPVATTGAATGRRYVFSGTARHQLVDPRDAPALLKSRYFRLEGVAPVPPGDGASDANVQDH